MRTKKLIIVAIKTIRDSRDAPISPKEGKLYMDGMINALNWVLEYKTANMYYCVDYKLPHKIYECPKCGRQE
jgi:hypothetical protein